MLNRKNFLLGAFAGCMLLFTSTACRRDEAPTIVMSTQFYGTSPQKAADIKRLSDGGYLIAGTAINGTSQSACLLRTDSLGTALWNRTYPNNGLNTTAKRVAVLPDTTGYLVGGVRTFAPNKSRIYLAKMDLNGNIISEAVLNHRGTTPTDDYYLDLGDMALMLNSDGTLKGIAITGRSSNVNRGKPNFNPDIDKEDLYTALVSPNFTVAWERNYGFQGNDEGCTIDVTDNTIIVAGNTEVYEGNSTTNPYKEIRIVKYEPNNGGIIAQVAYGDLGFNYLVQDAVYDPTLQELTILANPTNSNRMAFIQVVVPNNLGSNDITRQPNTTPAILSQGMSNGTAAQGARLEKLTNGLGFLVTGTFTNYAGDKEAQLVQFNNNFVPQREWFFGQSAVVDEGVALVASQSPTGLLESVGVLGNFTNNGVLVIGLERLTSQNGL